MDTEAQVWMPSSSRQDSSTNARFDQGWEKLGTQKSRATDRPGTGPWLLQCDHGIFPVKKALENGIWI